MTDEVVTRLRARRRDAAGVPCREEVEGTLSRQVGVAHQVLGPDRVEFLGAAGDQLVQVDLVTGVPDQAVLGEVVGQVEGQAELDHAKIAGEVRGAESDDADQLFAHLAGELAELPVRESLQVGRRLDPGQHRAAAHVAIPFERSMARARSRSPWGPSGAGAAIDLIGELPGALAARCHPEKAWVRPLPEPRVFTHSLPKFDLVSFDVEQVVDDLEREAHRMTRKFLALWEIRPERPATIAPILSEARSKAAVFRRWIASESLDRAVGLPLGLEVGHLAADHPLRARRGGQDLARNGPRPRPAGCA